MDSFKERRAPARPGAKSARELAPRQEFKPIFCMLAPREARRMLAQKGADGVKVNAGSAGRHCASG
jgi:hypothetical protein